MVKKMSSTNETREIELAISGMTCGNCVSHVSQALSGVPGVASVDVNLSTKRALVSFDPSYTPAATVDQLIKAVEKVRYGAVEIQ